jgi:serine phosphatase RsbU (regulator of sigma subunit)
VAARARLTFLAEASAALGSSLDYPATLTRVAELAVPRLADVCAIYLLEDQQVRLAALAHADPARAEASRSAVTLTPIRLDDLHGVGAVLRTGAAEVHDPFDEEAMAALARSPEHLEGLRALGLSAAVLVPLTARGRTIGALALGVRDGHGLAEDTLALAEQLAGRAGAAIDNARLYAQRLAAIQTLQASLLPPQLPTLPGLDLAARYVAGAAGVDVGGDFYDVFALDRNRSVVVLGDVCGRGVRAAGTALLIRHLIRAAAVHLPTPSAILAHLNRELLRHEHGHDRDPDFATAVLAVARPNPDRTATIELALAGHPRPLVRDCAGTVHPVGTPGALIGAIEQVEFTDTTLTMGPGSVLLCYTDGATERRGPGGFFGQRRLADVLATAHGDAARIAAAVETAVTAFAEDDLSDDLAVLVLRPSP